MHRRVLKRKIQKYEFLYITDQISMYAERIARQLEYNNGIITTE